MGCRRGWQTWVMWCFAQKEGLHMSCRMCRRIDATLLICALGHCKCDSHTVHKLSQQRLTADWLAPRESDCSRMRRRVSCDWLPCYIKANRPVLELFKTAGYFLDRHHMFILQQVQIVCVCDSRTETEVRYFLLWNKVGHICEGKWQLIFGFCQPVIRKSCRNWTGPSVVVKRNLIFWTFLDISCRQIDRIQKHNFVKITT